MPARELGKPLDIGLKDDGLPKTRTTMDKDLFLPGLPENLIRAAYLAAPGNEIGSGKFASPESSAALVANAFGLFLDQAAILPPLPDALDCGWPAVTVGLERIVRFPWRGGRHPCLDVLIVTGTALIGVESKRFEPFRPKTNPQMSGAYWREWGNQMMGYERCRDDMRDRGRDFERLDAAQLVKHAFGLRTAVHSVAAWAGKRPVLYYLYAEPESWPGGKPIPPMQRSHHRAEVAAFAEMTEGDEVLFRSCSYRQLLASWSTCPDELICAHADALRERFAI
jgi:hypothetical protein